MRQEAVMRRHRKTNNKAKARRKSRPKRRVRLPRSSNYGKTYVKPRYTLKLKPDFRIIDNPEIVAEQLRDLLKCRGKNEKHIRLDLDLRGVTHFDLGALTCLLSFLRFTTNYQGNHPEDPECRKFFVDSGFLTLMTDVNGHRFSATNSNNLMFEKGTDKTSNAKVGHEIRKAVKYLTGSEDRFQPVYSIIQEICPNSIEHANKKDKDVNWMMGIQYNGDKVCFAMSDKGYGILKTIKKTMSQILLDTFKDDKDILLAAFDKKYQSQTEDDNRNKGLPRIKSVADAGFVQNLTVITNNTLLNLSDDSKSRKLGVNFGGTFYYWEITKDTYYKWKLKK
ncbi:MAG: hypothetical protein NC335_08725 [Bacteroides sp.]|nr:hypothetical protein [Bacteroides sp.]